MKPMGEGVEKPMGQSSQGAGGATAGRKVSDNLSSRRGENTMGLRASRACWMRARLEGRAAGKGEREGTGWAARGAGEQAGTRKAGSSKMECRAAWHEKGMKEWSGSMISFM